MVHLLSASVTTILRMHSASLSLTGPKFRSTARNSARSRGASQRPCKVSALSVGLCRCQPSKRSMPRRPTKKSTKQHPRLQMSTGIALYPRQVPSAAPRLQLNISGARNGTTPKHKRKTWSFVQTTVAEPKSTSRTVLPQSLMTQFVGSRLRWTTSMPCRWAMAAHCCELKDAACVSGSVSHCSFLRSLCEKLAKLRRPAYSMPRTMQCLLCMAPSTRTMFRCSFRSDQTRSSRITSPISCTFLALSLLTILTAQRPCLGCSARQTMLKVPSPSGSRKR
mmetsp:Transcript_85738/g.247657  ORF Transcript_85738/g.247657 Transcript_85738/m.247657 type:complete len:279 (-) Transcript_85738:289-1125(-)